MAIEIFNATCEHCGSKDLKKIKETNRHIKFRCRSCKKHTKYPIKWEKTADPNKASRIANTAGAQFFSKDDPSFDCDKCGRKVNGWVYIKCPDCYPDSCIEGMEDDAKK